MKGSFCEGRESYRLISFSPVPSGSHPSLESSPLAVTGLGGQRAGSCCLGYCLESEWVGHRLLGFCLQEQVCGVRYEACV